MVSIITVTIPTTSKNGVPYSAPFRFCEDVNNCAFIAKDGRNEPEQRTSKMANKVFVILSHRAA
jgi:hypothetical protein